MTICRLAFAFLIGCMGFAPLRTAALELDLPAAATLTAERNSELDSYDAPLSAFDGQGINTLSLEGAIARRAFRISLPGLTPLQVMRPLREQLDGLGYDVVFECEATNCGGFDFRFNIEVLPGPNMYVNISRYRYLTALKGDPQRPDQAVTILVSVTADASYLQVITSDTTPAAASAPLPEAEAPALPAEEEPPRPLGARLLAEGRVILDGLDFAVGTTDLGPGSFASLSDLAAFLRDNPDLRVVLVGHTDDLGDLDANIAISRDRARSVRSRLIDTHGTDAAQLDAEGVGYLAPIAPNRTEQTRSLNRRVEAVLLNGQ